MEAWRARDADVAAIQAARSGDPFAVLGPHKRLPTAGLFASLRLTPFGVRAITLDGKLLAELPRRKDDFFEALIPSLKERPVYRVEVETTSGTSLGIGPLCVRTGSRSARRLSPARRLPSPAVPAARGAAHPARRRRGRAVRALGAERHARLRRRRFQPMGRTPLPDAQAHRQRAVGDLRPSPRGRSRLQIRACGTRRRASAA